MSPDEVTAHILARSSLFYSRSSGPGGQHRDHTENRAELIVDRDALVGLPEPLAAVLLRGLRLDRHPLRIVSQRAGSRERNRQHVARTLRDRVERTMTPRPARVATRPSKASIARRLDQKARRSTTKALRRRPAGD